MSNAFKAVCLLLFLPIFFVACDEDLCKNVDCSSNGTCIDGSCQCNDGFQDSNCATETRMQFLGSYMGTEKYPSPNPPGGIITAAGKVYTVSAGNEGAAYITFNGQFSAKIDNAGSFTFKKGMWASINYEITGGDGSFSNGKLNFQMQLIDHTLNYSLTKTFSMP